MHQLSNLTASLPARSRSFDVRGNMTENETQVDSSIIRSQQTLPYATNIPSSLSRYGVSLMDVSVSAVTNTVAYDPLGRPIAITDGRGNTTLTEYNSFGQRSASIDALGNRTTYTYDQFGNLSSVTDPLGNVTVYEYDLRGNKVLEYGATYPVRYTYDIFGNKTSMATFRAGFVPDASASGDITTWLYDIASGAMTNKVYADGKGPTYSYTPDGKLSQRIWARGIATEYSYDNWNNLTNTAYSDGTQTIALSYDALGRQTEAHDAAGVTTFLYDSFGSLTNETVIGVAGTNTIIRHWDNFGRSAGYTLNNVRQTTIGYEPDKGRIATMEIADNLSTTTTNIYNYFRWTYLPGSDLKSSLAYPNGLTASWQYDSNNQLLQVRNATSTNVISQYDYTYEPAGRRVAIGRSGSAMSETRTDEYGYNIRGELISAAKNAEGAKVLAYQYQYDDIGNRITSLDLGTNRTYTANNLNQYTSISNFCGSLPSVALAEEGAGEFIPQFDDDGNQTLIKTATGIWQVQYNGENRPILWECVSTNSPTPNSSTPTLISMSYDRMGRRVTKNNQRFVYDGYLQVANFEHSVTNSQLTTYNFQLFIWDPTEKVATRPLVWNCEVSAAYYVHDGNKNVSEVVESNGDVVAHYEYAPFGAVIAQCGVSVAANPWRFSSEYAEDDTVTVYYNYRHYESVMGRWLSRDLIGERVDVKLYCSANNASLNATDFLGLFDDGGVYEECVEIQYVYEHVPGVGFVCRQVCLTEPVYKKGHKDFTNNGTRCPFDYTKEDKDWKSRPETPWGIWRHFRSLEDVEKSLNELLVKMGNEKKCDPDKFERLMHQLQDYYAHYKPGWRWWTLGHLFGGHGPDLGKIAQEKRWPEAERATKKWIKKWNEHCKLKDDCKDKCVWEYVK